jgi:hypothetical protein
VEILNIGMMAREYGILPSEVRARATAYDIMVYDVVNTWENHQKNPNSTENYSTEQLKEIMEKHKNGTKKS